MATKTTKHSPDTCPCVFEYTWDDTTTESNRVHILSTFITKCPAHSSITDDNNRWNVIIEEYTRKGNALTTVLEVGPSTLYNVVGTTRQLKDTVGFNFLLSGEAPNRVLTISFTGVTLTTNQKNTIQSALNTRFGSGRVLII